MVQGNTRYRQKPSPSRPLDAYLALLVCVAVGLIARQLGIEMPATPIRADQVEPSVSAFVAAAVPPAASEMDNLPDAAQPAGQAARNIVMSGARMSDQSWRPDPAAVSTALRPIAGVRSFAWMDATHLRVTVASARFSSQATIDQICQALKVPLADSVAAVVNLQTLAAEEGGDAGRLTRSCRSPRR